jgi:prepilin-type N-terminal cleavage/methylation domain-containing protein
MKRNRFFGFTLVELLVVILIISVLAGFLVPAVFQGRKRVARIQCTNHLRSIGQAAMGWSTDNKGFLPVMRSEEPMAYESFQIMVDDLVEAREPEMYVCPSSQDLEAEVDEEGLFQLDEDTVSYAWRNTRLRTSSGSKLKTPIGCDNSIAIAEEGIEENHDDGMTILFLDSSVEFMTIKELESNSAYEDGGLEEYFAKNKLGI